MPKLSTLADFFGGATLDPTLWNASSASPNVTVDTALDRVAVACTTSYYSLGSTTWDATRSAVYARVVPAPPGNGSTETFFEVLLDANNKASLLVSGGVFSARVTNAGVATTTTIAANAAAYDPYNYAWWRITEAGSSFVFATSPDAYTWTTRATIAYTWAATGVKFQFVSGYFGTESASTAYIDHVNTTVSAPGQINLNWPTIEDGWGPLWNANGGAIPADRYVSVSDRTRGNVGVTRGRQYETDQVRSGEATLTLANPDGALDPGNATGPWAGHVLPYQPYKRRAMWPPSRNLLTQAQATGGDGNATGPIPASIGVLSTADPAGGQIVAAATAYQGGNVFAFAVAAGIASTTRIGYTNQVAVTPGQTYTVQLRVRNVTASTSVSVQPHVAYYGSTPGAIPTTFVYGGTVVLTGSATAPWSLVSVTVTVPASVYGMSVGVSTAATVAAACSVQVDGWQLEKGATASTWTCPGVWSPIYAGFTERWPSSWNMGGTYGVVSPTQVDAFSLLSQQQLSDSLTQEINSHSPRFFYRLDDPSGSTSAADQTGNYPAAPLAISKYGAGSLVFGTAITAVNTTTGVYTGSTGTVATVSNPSPGVNAYGASTYLALNKAGIAGPANPAGAWTRMCAFRYTAGSIPASAAYFWSSMDSTRGTTGTPGGAVMYWYIDSGGAFHFTICGPAGGATGFVPGPATAADGNWHLAIVSYSHATAQLTINLDGTSTTWPSVNPNLEPTGLVSDNFGAYVDVPGGGYSTLNFKGDLSFCAEFPSALSGTDMTNLYTAWRSACAGESTAARYSRILRYSGYSGSSSVQAGLTTSMGPANIAGQDAVSALQAVVDTEAGAHYVDRAGTVTFRSRASRYNATVPVFTFGENAAAGEWPYEDCQTDYDSTHLSNTVTVTQEGTQQAFYATDATSTTAYFPRTMTRTINSNSALECQDAANYLLSRYRQPATRVSSIKLHPSASPAMWPVCLALELGTRVRVIRRPNGAPATTIECFVENIAWDFSDTGDATVTLQCSPADTTPYSVFAAWHTTLKTTVASGVASITVNASADTVNALAAQLGPGQQIVLGQGTANQETVTVQAVGATSSGWTSAVITLTANTTKAHNAGELINEPLPSGVTDPTTYDAVCAFDAVAFAY